MSAPVSQLPVGQSLMGAVAPEEVNQALWNALRICAQAAAGAAADDSRKTKDFADATNLLATAIVQLDPSLIAPQGVPPEVLAAAQPVQQAQQPSGSSGKKE